MEEIKEGNE